MKRHLFKKDLVGLKSEDFNFISACSNRETGKPEDRWGDSLKNILKTSKVCISGYLIFKLKGVRSTSDLIKRYNVSDKQLDAIIFPELTIETVSEVFTTPHRDSDLETVMEWINQLLTKDWFLDDNFDTSDTQEYTNSI